VTRVRTPCSAALAALLILLATATIAADRLETPDRLEATRVALREAALRAGREPRPATIPRDAFLERARIVDVMPSHDGRHVAYRLRGEQRSELWVREIDGASRTRLLADVGPARIAWGEGQSLWLADTLGLAVIDTVTAEVRRIVKWDRTRHQRWWGLDRRAPAYSMIAEKLGVEGRWRHRCLRVDRSGKTSLLLEHAQPLRDLALDDDGALAFSAVYDGTAFDTVVRRHTANDAREIVRCHGIEHCRLIGFEHGGDTLHLLTHRGEDTLAVVRWQARDGRLQTLHRDPARVADARDVLATPDGRWLAVSYHADRRRWHGRDATTDAQLAALARRLPDANLSLDASIDGQRWFVRAQHATWSRDRYYAYVPANDALVPLFEDLTDASALDPKQLSPAVPLAYRASDGRTLYGYVYLPRGVSPARAPLIAMPHGGPYNRDDDDFEPLAQLLANRGCVVFLPNFRASKGHGLGYLEAAGGDFGDGRVLADIVEGLDFLLAQGIGDRTRQAIAGHSFGGYASLLAVAHHPQRFRFALGSAAPVEFVWGMQWVADNGGSALPEDGPPAALFFRQHGMPFGDVAWRERMRRESPLAHVASLATPVYLWAGARDDRVPLIEVVRYAGDARRHERPVTLLIDPEAGHSPEMPLGFEALVWMVERAASLHFGTALTPASPGLAAFVAKNLRIDAAAQSGLPPLPQ